MLVFVRERLQYRWRAYSFALWLKHFFVPMYGQYDFAGRVVSVFMRLAVLLGRGVAFFFEVFAYGALMVFWLGLPLITFVFFFVNLFQGFMKLF